MNRRRLFRLAAILAALLLFCVLLSGALLLGGYFLRDEIAGLLESEANPPAQEAGGPLPAVIAGDAAGMTMAEALAVEPEEERPAVLAEMGPPDAFSLRFETLEGQTVRWESWSYFDFNSRFDFIDGQLLWRVTLEPVPDGSIYAHFYDPADFRAGMSVAAVRTLLGEQELETVDLAEGDIVGALVLAGDQILLGFQDGRLVFVETVILSPGDGGERLPLTSDDYP